jgi:hypothetical protein
LGVGVSAGAVEDVGANVPYSAQLAAPQLRDWAKVSWRPSAFE